MNCPFCQAVMEEFDYILSGKGPCTTYACKTNPCTFHDIPRYKVRMTDAGEKLAEFIILEDTIYLHINYLDKQTNISKLEVILLSDTIHIAHALQININNYQETLTKIKLLIILS